MANILLLGSGTQAYAILKPIRDDGHIVIMLTGESVNYGDKSRFVNEVIRTKLSPSDINYLSFVKNLINNYRIDVILPMSDSTAEFLSKNKKELQKICKFKSPDYVSFMKGYDKNQLMALCKNNDYSHPYTIDLSMIDVNSSEIDTFPYPGIIKPNCTTGGRGMVVVTNANQFRQAYVSISKKHGDCHLQRFVKSGGKQFKVQLYINENGKLLAHSVLEKVRWFPLKGGSSCCAITINNVSLVSICYSVLKSLNWVGFADFDIIEDPETNEFLIMEINPRLPACIGASICAGVNWAQIIIDDAMGYKVKYSSCLQGVVLRHLGLDILWFVKSDMRFKIKPSWFHFRGSKVYFQDFHLNDLRPFLLGTWHNFMGLFKADYKNKTMNYD